MILLAFVPNNLEENQELGWGIIKSQKIVAEAKREYLLVTLPVNARLMYQGRKAAELQEIVASFKGQAFFVIVNSALYPIASWGATADDEFIISRLNNGDGP
ncbi:hypothetical protein [Hymenobacter cellulosilyticus]|uniref:Uncharacterized protein n=1 Tax=Hymenobacter cellulosilyticus TaxID=2932248 RepID=A0A8T9Q8Q0_9BACT|nr:hypothetical protein [Hymenobacter cellulosilyticus]UOQ71383.1 hypothetical protein MUN79_22590 [Hymenobacter cellulosilyticus]